MQLHHCRLSDRTSLYRTYITLYLEVSWSTKQKEVKGNRQLYTKNIENNNMVQ